MPQIEVKYQKVGILHVGYLAPLRNDSRGIKRPVQLYPRG